MNRGASTWLARMTIRMRHLLAWHYERVADLDAFGCGVSDDVVAVGLVDGTIFYGHLPAWWERVIYRCCMPRYVKDRIPENCFGVAHDIIMRYISPDVSWLSPGMTVVEVGAYTGFWAMRCAELVGPKGCVVAIEAEPCNAALLRANVAGNCLDNVYPVAKAAWRERGELPLYRYRRQINGAYRVDPRQKNLVNVPCDTVDGMLAELGVGAVDAVRIQVNGAEDDVLAGMTETLKYNPRLRVARWGRSALASNRSGVRES